MPMRPMPTVLSMLRKPIPASHYMIAAFGGDRIECTDYAPFGTQELSELAVAGLGQRLGVLLGSHGMIAVGPDLKRAIWLAGELETLARLHYLAGLAGGPVILPDAEVLSLVENSRPMAPGRKKHNGFRTIPARFVSCGNTRQARVGCLTAL